MKTYPLETAIGLIVLAVVIYAIRIVFKVIKDLTENG
jgi:hypothetical protein